MSMRSNSIYLPVEPAFSGNCHCRDCQRSSGGSLTPAMFFPETAVEAECGFPVALLLAAQIALVDAAAASAEQFACDALAITEPFCARTGYESRCWRTAAASCAGSHSFGRAIGDTRAV